MTHSEKATTDLKPRVCDLFGCEVFDGFGNPTKIHMLVGRGSAHNLLTQKKEVCHKEDRSVTVNAKNQQPWHKQEGDQQGPLFCWGDYCLSFFPSCATRNHNNSNDLLLDIIIQAAVAVDVYDNQSRGLLGDVYRGRVARAAPPVLATTTTTTTHNNPAVMRATTKSQ